MCITDAGESSSILSVVTSLKSSLVEMIEPDFGLLDDLLGLGVLDRRQVARVRSERTVFDENDALLDLLSSVDQCDTFVTALRRTDQHHVANFIAQNGGQKHKVVLTYLSLECIQHTYKQTNRQHACANFIAVDN